MLVVLGFTGIAFSFSKKEKQKKHFSPRNKPFGLLFDKSFQGLAGPTGPVTRGKPLGPPAATLLL